MRLKDFDQSGKVARASLLGPAVAVNLEENPAENVSAVREPLTRLLEESAASAFPEDSPRSEQPSSPTPSPIRSSQMGQASSGVEAAPNSTSGVSEPAAGSAAPVTPIRSGPAPISPATTPFPPVAPSPPGSSTLTIPTEERGEGAPPPTPNSDPVNSPPNGSGSPTAKPTVPSDVLELKADSQDYDERRQVFTAEGRVLMRFRQAVLTADRLQVNLVNRIAVAEGNVVLTRGDQVLRGQRFEYNLIQGEGTVQRASGEIYLPQAGTDLAATLPTDTGATAQVETPVGDRIAISQPRQVTSGGGVSVLVGSGRAVSGPSSTVFSPTGGRVNRVRFEAEKVDFTPSGWVASKIRITNDPFSPPELELRADRARLNRISPLQDEVVADNPRLVFDQSFSLPLFQNRLVLDRRERQPGLFRFGFDSDERGGLFVERTFDVFTSDTVRFNVTPQFLVQRAIEDGFGADAFGLKSRLQVTLGPRTSIRGRLSLSSLDLTDAENNLRASLRAQQIIGTHALGLEYSYRDRLFNGSLGFQTVQRSVGLLLTSPIIALGNTGINMSYQAGYQYINADTDRVDLLEPIRENNRINLSRFQASVAFSRGFLLWQGKPLPATPQAGLRFSPSPLVPYLILAPGVTGVASYYSSDDTQANLGLNLTLLGQFGHFSRNFLDYTAFNVTYSQVVRSGLSPFLFDRAVDTQVLYAGIMQQIYGPIRVGFQTAFNLNTGQEISTDYLVEYARRTYSVLLRYNPVLQIGSVNLRISDFNWTGGNEPFSGTDITPVNQGVRRISD